MIHKRFGTSTLFLGSTIDNLAFYEAFYLICIHTQISVSGDNQKYVFLVYEVATEQVLAQLSRYTKSPETTD